MLFGKSSEKKARPFLTLPPFQDNHLRNFKLTRYQLLEVSKGTRFEEQIVGVTDARRKKPAMVSVGPASSGWISVSGAPAPVWIMGSNS